MFPFSRPKCIYYNERQNKIYLYYNNKYRSNTNRLSSWDYGFNGRYFITICTQKRKHYFGEIDPEGILLQTEIAQHTSKCWYNIPEIYPFVVLDTFIIMPDHLHGILQISKGEIHDYGSNKFGVQSNNLGSIIRGFKGAVKRFANSKNIEFQWQTNYYDRIIRNDKEHKRISDYILNNPVQWRQRNY